MPSETRFPVTMTVNGGLQTIEVAARRSLADVLREDLRLTGTHLGCEHGICGTCTVLMDGLPVRSCLILAVQADGSRIDTVEGLESDQLHPVQTSFSRNHALQCGYCTPGFLMLVTGVVNANPAIGDEELTEALSANLCRCTGYQRICAAAREYRDGAAGRAGPPTAGADVPREAAR